jgi:hypothetical protein
MAVGALLTSVSSVLGGSGLSGGGEAPSSATSSIGSGTGTAGGGAFTVGGSSILPWLVVGLIVLSVMKRV